MTQASSFVAFTIAGTRYGIDVGGLTEVVNMVALTPVPESPARASGRKTVAGLVNVRGRVLPVISLRALLSLPETAPTLATRILIVRSRSESVGLIVDAVQGVLAPEPERLTRVQPRVAGEGGSDVLSAIYQEPDGMVLLLDMEALLGHADIVGFGESAGTLAGSGS
ncbi:MAG: chemotaxis protein CheW [Candidatus Wallbacteria bacterium]|nr:chemotaxis protein CheW [Candidatus Wallbacteria bacterium]